jgi:pimeloyl-ACP methyl ester carboxylesterase
MAQGDTTRKLAAIVAADVAGYSRLMGADEAGTLAALESHRGELIDPKIAEHRGRIANTAGDSLLIEFPSANEALACAVEVQRAMAERLGDGVNVAARLEAIAPPGGICVSEAVKDALGSRAAVRLQELGPQRLKNVSKPVRAFVVAEKDIGTTGSQAEFALSDQRSVRYALSGDGVSIAYTDVGDGYPMVFVGSWMSHLEKDWESPSMRHYLTHLPQRFHLLRYDQRGNGMSDWDGVDISFERMVDDLETVIDCFDYEKVAILGPSQAASVSIAYAQRRPDRVSHLILYGGYARGRRRRGNPEAVAESEALVTLIRQGWGADNPAFRQTMTSLFMPDASPEEAAWFNDFQKTCGPAENIARFREMFDDMDVSGLLDEIRIPTLVIHCSEDSVAPISEGKFLASRISGAQFVMLKSKNHMIFENEPAFPKFIQSILDFVE